MLGLAEIGEGLGLLERALSFRAPGLYQVQAAIAAEHARARRAESTDWELIAAYYGELAAMSPGPVVALNRAAAVGMAYGPEQGLALIDEIEEDGGLEDYYLMHAARADLLRRTRSFEAAASAYEKALALCHTEPERRYLAKRLAEMRAER